MITFGHEGNIGLTVPGVLKSELDCTTVNTAAPAVPGTEPGNTTVELGRNGSSPLRRAITLVEKQRGTVATVIGECDLVRLGVDSVSKEESSGDKSRENKHAAVTWF